MPSPTRLMLVDDHDLVRTGLKTFLETKPGLEVVAEANSGESALKLLEQIRPDVIVMDITMPGMDGLQATRQIAAQFPECKVLALTVHSDKQYFFEMLSAGAAGYITKQAAADELVDAVRTVAQGNVYLQPALASWLLEDYRLLLAQSAERTFDQAANQPNNGSSDALHQLSRREIQVLEYVAQGLTNPEIGERLGISPKTVARHRERIMSRLDMHSCVELVKFAIRTGLVEVN
jgi:DNA-binding NarL/FixJ family response regulator